jgi:peptidoglycan hydrolase CwlO-like protein
VTDVDKIQKRIDAKRKQLDKLYAELKEAKRQIELNQARELLRRAGEL